MINKKGNVLSLLKSLKEISLLTLILLFNLIAVSNAQEKVYKKYIKEAEVNYISPSLIPFRKWSEKEFKKASVVINSTLNPQTFNNLPALFKDLKPKSDLKTDKLRILMVARLKLNGLKRQKIIVYDDFIIKIDKKFYQANNQIYYNISNLLPECLAQNWREVLGIDPVVN